MNLKTLLLAGILAFATQNCFAAFRADFDMNGSIQFADFLILSTNFGNAGTHAQGDADGNGMVEFADFLILSTEFGGDIITTEAQLLEKLADIEENGGTPKFCVLDSATDGLDALTPNITSLTIKNVDGGSIGFLGALPVGISVDVVDCSDLTIVNLKAQASHPFPSVSNGGPDTAGGEFFGVNVGVLNVVECTNLILQDLDITNTNEFQESAGDENSGTDPAVRIPATTSVALNIDRSRNITVEDSRFESFAKSCVMIHSNSQVLIRGTTPATIGNEEGTSKSRIRAKYFELNVAASQVTVEDTELYQHFVLQEAPNTGAPDSHPAINVSATPERFGLPSDLDVDGDGNLDFEMIDKNSDGTVDDYVFVTPTTVTLTDVKFNMRTGRPIVAGNAAFLHDPNDPDGGILGAKGIVTLNNPEIDFGGTIDGSGGVQHGAVEHGSSGFIGYAGTWNSIELVLNGGIVHGHPNEANGDHTKGLVPISQRLVDFVSTTGTTSHPNEGLGKYINYQGVDEDGDIVRPRIGETLLPPNNVIFKSATDPTAELDVSNFDPNL